MITDIFDHYNNDITFSYHFISTLWKSENLKMNWDVCRDIHTEPHQPFCIAGLFWRLVALEDGLDDSASESLLVSMDTMTSFIPEGFSWEDSNSSGRMNARTDGKKGGRRREKIHKKKWKLKKLSTQKHCAIGEKNSMALD